MQLFVRMMLALFVSAGFWMAAGCSPALESAKEREALEAQSTATIVRLKAGDASLNKKLADSAGYAMFPSVIKGGAGLGGAYGNGVLYSNVGVVIGYCDLSQASIGLQLGGQEYSELIVFKDAAAVERFKSGSFAFAAQTTAVAANEGAAANADFSDGVIVFTRSVTGLMYEASIGGQNFNYVNK